MILNRKMHVFSEVLVLGAILLVAVSAFYFLGVRFELSNLEKTVMALVVTGLLFFSARQGLHHFFLTGLTGGSVFVALACALAGPPPAPSPLTTNFILGAWPIFLLSFALALMAWRIFYIFKQKDGSFAAILLAVFVINWLILGFNVKFFDDWKIENYLTVPFLILIYITHRWFKLSNASYGLLFAYMMFHIVGSHYTYAEVPFGHWLKDALEMSRNHYDRIVHFSFGFLLAYPIRELTIRITNAKGFWGFYIPVEFVLAFSAIYEILEWIVALVYGGDLGVAYLGTQGDEWDAIKDMALAGGGAVAAMLIVFIVLIIYNRKNFWKEFIDSFRVKQTSALGEKALKRFQDNN